MNRVLTKLKSNLVSLDAIDKLTKQVATGVRASNLRRIHNDGQAVNGSKIGNYSTKSIYINPKNSPRKFATSGKNSNNSNFKNGKKRKTKYFKDGYKGFRSEIGKETAYVNLQLTGSLKADFNMVKTTYGWSIGFNEKSKIADGLEQHFNKRIWGISQQDRDVINTIIRNFISKIK